MLTNTRTASPRSSPTEPGPAPMFWSAPMACTPPCAPASTRMRPAPTTPGCSDSRAMVDDDPNDPATTAIAPATTVFAFGKRAYYLYWKRPDGRIGWGANLPSTEYLSLKQARAIPAGQWLDTLRATYCDDTPGARLAAATTTATFTAVGALHIMPPVAHWHRGRMVLVGGRGARAVQQHRAGCLVGDGKRAAACPLPSRSADRARGIRRLRTAAALAGGEDRRAGRQNQSRQGAGARCQAADALADADHRHGDEHREDH